MGGGREKASGTLIACAQPDETCWRARRTFVEYDTSANGRHVVMLESSLDSIGT